MAGKCLPDGVLTCIVQMPAQMQMSASSLWAAVRSTTIAQWAQTTATVCGALSLRAKGWTAVTCCCLAIKMSSSGSWGTWLLQCHVTCCTPAR